MRDIAFARSMLALGQETGTDAMTDLQIISGATFRS